MDRSACEQKRTQLYASLCKASMYFPITQEGPNGIQLVVRTNLPLSSLASSVLHTLCELNPNHPATEFHPIRGIVDHASLPRRFFMVLVAAFAALGLIPAGLGICMAAMKRSKAGPAQAIMSRMT